MSYLRNDSYFWFYFYSPADTEPGCFPLQS